MTSVKGGTLQAAAAMRAKLDKDGLMDLETYQNWAASIADVPALIYSEVGMTDVQNEANIMIMFSAMLEAWKKLTVYQHHFDLDSNIITIFVLTFCIYKMTRMTFLVFPLVLLAANNDFVELLTFIHCNALK